MITQQELTEYRAAAKLAGDFEEQLKQRKAGLMAREGEEIEPGLLTMKVSERAQKTFSYDAMVDLFGRAEADRVKDLLPERRSKVLSVALA